MSAISTHVLDTAQGKPAAGIAVRLERQDGTQWKALGSGATDGNGRATGLLGSQPLQKGVYRLTFETGAYQTAGGFFPWVVIPFEVKDPGQHYHVPLLLSPYGYSTYRGS